MIPQQIQHSIQMLLKENKKMIGEKKPIIFYIYGDLTHLKNAQKSIKLLGYKTKIGMDLLLCQKDCFFNQNYIESAYAEIFKICLAHELELDGFDFKIDQNDHSKKTELKIKSGDIFSFSLKNGSIGYLKAIIADLGYFNAYACSFKNPISHISQLNQYPFIYTNPISLSIQNDPRFSDCIKIGNLPCADHVFYYRAEHGIYSNDLIRKIKGIEDQPEASISRDEKILILSELQKNPIKLKKWGMVEITLKNSKFKIKENFIDYVPDENFEKSMIFGYQARLSEIESSILGEFQDYVYLSDKVWK